MQLELAVLLEERLQKPRRDVQLPLILPAQEAVAPKEGGLDPQRVREDEGTARRGVVLPLLEIMVLPLLRLDIDLRDRSRQK